MPDLIDVDAPRGAFGATVTGVTDHLPAARFVEQLEPGRRGVTYAQVAGFVDEITARVSVRLDQLGRLVDDLEDAVIAAARELVHIGAASRAQAARFPEQSARNADAYAAVLWAQFESGLDELEAELTEQLAGPGNTDGPLPVVPGSRIAMSFPPPRITDGMRF
jgi:hypothetical protein